MKKNTLFTLNLSRYLKLLSFTISLLIILFLTVSSSNQVNDYLSTEYLETNKSALLKSANSIQKNLDRAATYINEVSTNPMLTDMIVTLDNENVSPVQKYHTFTELQDYLFYLRNEMPAVEDIWLITDDKQYRSPDNTSNFDLNGAELITYGQTNALYTMSEFLYSIRPSDPHYSSMNLTHVDELENRYFFSTNLKDERNNHIGIAIFFLDSSELMNSVLNLENYQIRYKKSDIVYNGRNFKSQFDQSENSYSVDEQTDKSVVMQTIPSYDLSLALESPRFSSINKGIFSVIFFVAATLLFFFIFHMNDHYVMKVTTPLKQLIAQMKQSIVLNQNDTIVESKRMRFSFREKLFGYFLFTIIFPVALFYLGHYFFLSTIVVDDIQEIKHTEHESKVSIINAELDKVKMLLVSFPYDYAIADVSSSDTVNEDDYIQREINAYLDPLASVNVTFYSSEGRLISSTSSLVPKDINRKRYNFEDRTIQSRFRLNTRSLTPSSKVLDLTFPKESINTPNDEPDPLMTASMADSFLLDISTIEDAVSEDIIFNDEPLWNLSTVESSNSSNSFSERNSNVITFISELSLDDLSYQSSFNVSHYTSEIRDIFLRNSYILFLMILLVFVLSYVLTLSILKPFNKIIEVYHSKENLKDQIVTFEGLSSIDEINDIKRSFKDSLLALDRSIEDKIDIERKLIDDSYKKREIQLFALQNQVNPHFLYNSLDNLLFLVESQQTDTAVNMVNSLSRFFQFVTNREDILITLSEEITFTQHYLNIMKERFENFVVKWSVDESLLETKLLKLIIQPIVENVIHHGVRHSEDIITLSLFIKSEKDVLVITVVDNARGIDSLKLDRIRQELRHSSFSKSGLYNVNDRLNLYYGERAELSLSSEKGEGTTVEIKIPMEEPEYLSTAK